MKKIKSPLEITTRNVNAESDADAYFGVTLSPQSHSTGFIVQEAYRRGNYCIVAAHRITVGNGWANIQHPQLNACLWSALNLGFRIFKFEKPEQLFAWLSKFKTS